MSTQWFCRILQEEFGPMDFDELQQLALSGTLDRGDLVRRETEDVWRAASKWLELRATFGELEPTADSRPTRNESTSEERIARQDRAADEDTSSRVIEPNQFSDLVTPRQRWIAGSATVGLMLVLFFADRLVTSAIPTFPQPRQVREQLAGWYWFLGTGPWRPWECRLLWVDALVILSIASGWLTRKLTH